MKRLRLRESSDLRNDVGWKVEADEHGFVANSLSNPRNIGFGE